MTHRLRNDIARLVIALVPFGSSAVCTAQGARAPLPRDTVFGLVRDADGEPVPGAEVRLLARPMGDVPAAGGADEIEVRTDERGRFRAEILLGRAYTAWAFTAGVEGERVSAVAEDVFAAVPVVLDLSEPRPPVLVRVRGNARWKDDAPLRWEIVVAARNRIVADGELPADGVVTLPPLPRGAGELGVLRSDGRVLAVWDVDTEGGALDEVLPEPPGAGILVRAGGDGSFALDPRVHVGLGGSLREVASSEALGFVRAPCADRQLFVTATLLGIAPVQPGKGVRPPKTWPERPGPEPDLHVHLGRGVVAKGRVLIDDDVPAVDARLVTDEIALHYRQARNHALAFASRVRPVFAGGHWRIGSLINEFGASATLVIGDDTLARLPRTWTERGLIPLVHDAMWVEEGADGDVDLGELVLSECVPVRLVARTGEGAPASHARFALLREGEMPQLGLPPLRWSTTDRLGETTVLIPKSRRSVLGVSCGGGLAMVTLETHEGAFVAEPIELTMRVPEPKVVRVRAVDPAGAVVAGAPVTVRASAAGVDVVILRGLMPVDLGDAPARVDHPRLEVGPLRDAALFHRFVGEVVRASTEALVTGDDGRFQFAVPDGPIELMLGSERVGRPLLHLSEIPDREVELELPHR